MNSNFELAGPLAGLFGGIQQGQEEERQRLANVYQDLQNQRYGGMTPNEVAKSNLEGALATGKLEGGYVPEAVKAAVGEQQAKAQEFDLEKGLSNIELARTALDAGMAPDAVAQRFNVNLDTPFGQAYLKDPHGTLDHVYDKMIKRRSDTVKQRQAVELQNLKDDADLKRTQLSASTLLQGQKYAADRAVMVQAAGLAKNAEDNAAKYATLLQKIEPGAIDKQLAAKIKAANPELAGVDDNSLRDTLAAQLKYYQNEAQRYKAYLPPMGNVPASETPPPVKGGKRRSLDSFDPSAQPQKPAPAPVAAPVQPVPVAATPQATPTPEPVPTQQPTQAPQPTAVEQVSQVPTQRVFGRQQQINPVMLGESSSGYLPRGGQQILHDRTAQRKQAQVDMLKRQFAEATLEVSKWEGRTHYPYGRAKLTEAQQALEEARTKLSALQ